MENLIDLYMYVLSERDESDSSPKIALFNPHTHILYARAQTHTSWWWRETVTVRVSRRRNVNSVFPAKTSTVAPPLGRVDVAALSHIGLLRLLFIMIYLQLQVPKVSTRCTQKKGGERQMGRTFWVNCPFNIGFCFGIST